MRVRVDSARHLEKDKSSSFEDVKDSEHEMASVQNEVVDSNMTFLVAV